MTNPWPGSPKTHSVGDERDVGNTPTTRSRYGQRAPSHGDAPPDMPRESGRLVPRGRRVLAWCVDEGVQDQFVGTSLDTVAMALLTHTGQGATEAKLGIPSARHTAVPGWTALTCRVERGRLAAK
jgi:hypothetical protein